MVQTNNKTNKTYKQIDIDLAKRVWDDTLDLKDVAWALGITQFEALDIVRPFVTEEQVRRLNEEDDEWE